MKKPASTTRTPKAEAAPEGDRIAKVLSRAGVASRRDAERMIAAGEVAVNGKVIDSPALNVGPKDRITVNGKPLAPPEPARLWLYYKPEGLVTSAADEKGRDTVFDHLPEDMPRVMSVGRLDLNSEGLLLLTNDGELKRRLELPSTGWLRKYRVRVKGNPTDPDLDPLRRGITIDGEHFQPMQVVLDRVQGANAWLTVGLREGRNREIRRAMTAIGLTVNRLIRISYGPFRLNELQPGEVEEVRAKVLRDQLGVTGDAADAPVGRPAPRGGKPVVRTTGRTDDDAPRTTRGARPAPARGAAGREDARGTAPGGGKTFRTSSRNDDAPRGRSGAGPSGAGPSRPARSEGDSRAPKAGAKTYRAGDRAEDAARPARSGKAAAPRGDGDARAPRGAKPGPRSAGADAPRGGKSPAPRNPRGGEAVSRPAPAKPRGPAPGRPGGGKPGPRRPGGKG